jgi:hypothetical protein
MSNKPTDPSNRVRYQQLRHKVIVLAVFLFAIGWISGSNLTLEKTAALFTSLYIIIWFIREVLLP